MHFSRLIGVIYVVGAVFGLVISLGGLLLLWTTKSNVTNSIIGVVALGGRTVEATSITVNVMGTSLDQAGTSLKLIQIMLVDTGTSLKNSGELVRSTGGLVGVNMVDFVDNAKSSLASMQNSAQVVDNMLRTITGIPLIGPWLGGQRYNPDVPLAESVAKVSKSMDPLPDSLKKIRSDLDVSAENIATVKSEVDSAAKQMDSIQASLTDAQKEVEDYKSIISELQTRYTRFQTRLPAVLNTFYIGLTVILIWILITQVGMLLHGIELMDELGRNRFHNT